MGVVGKIVGGTIGFAVAGPLGALAGAAFGHVLDASGEMDEPRLSCRKSPQSIFYVAAFSMLAKLVRVDGPVKQKEMDAVTRLMVDDLNLDALGRNTAMHIFHSAMDTDRRFEDFAFQFYAEFANRPQYLELMIDILVRIASADGRITHDKEKLVLAGVDIFHLSRRYYRSVLQKYAKGAAGSSYAVLGCTIDDSDDMIKHRYRKRVSDFHPDKIASKGLPEDFIRFANEKFQEIQAAYEDIKKSRGLR
ncbi:MAG: TerB family tellurite resistance protein [Desulfobacterales bacterium]